MPENDDTSQIATPPVASPAAPPAPPAPPEAVPGTPAPTPVGSPEPAKTVEVHYQGEVHHVAPETAQGLMQLGLEALSQDKTDKTSATETTPAQSEGEPEPATDNEDGVISRRLSVVEGNLFNRTIDDHVDSLDIVKKSPYIRQHARAQVMTTIANDPTHRISPHQAASFVAKQIETMLSEHDKARGDPVKEYVEKKVQQAASPDAGGGGQAVQPAESKMTKKELSDGTIKERLLERMNAAT